jgi:hypothetical protein
VISRQFAGAARTSPQTYRYNSIIIISKSKNCFEHEIFGQCYFSDVCARTETSLAPANLAHATGRKIFARVPGYTETGRIVLDDVHDS